MEIYQKVATYDAKRGEVKKIILLYSGSLASLLLIPWLKKNYKAEVVTLLIDLGQKEDFSKLNKQAKKYGATKTLVINAQDEFVNNYITHAIKANATYQETYHLADPMGKALCAKLAVQIAQAEGAGAIAHACAPQSSDQLRLDGTILALDPDMKIIAPFRDGRLSYLDIAGLAKKYTIEDIHHIDNAHIYSYDENLWGNAILGGEIEQNIQQESLEPYLRITTDPRKAPDEPEQLILSFEQGIPTHLNGKNLPLKTIVQKLTEIGGKHGIGITYGIKDNIFGLKARAINEEPAATLIIFAHKALESYVCTAEENRFMPWIEAKWTTLCYGGRWLEPLLQDCTVLIDTVNQKVTGEVALQVYKGKIAMINIVTPKKIFEQKLGILMNSGVINQRATTGYIEIATLPMQLAHQDKKNILLTIGKRDNKMKLLTQLTALDRAKFTLYATYKTHKYLAKQRITSILVNKMSAKHLQPNLRDLLMRGRFNMIIHIPSSKKPTANEKEAAKFIQLKALQQGIPHLTSIEDAQNALEQLITTEN